MTIVVASVSPEGIALAADSRTTERYGSHRRVTSESAHKVFDARGRYGVATYGQAMIGKRTIRGLFDDWLATVEQVPDLDDFAEILGAEFRSRLDVVTPAKRVAGPALIARTWPLGFLVAGFDSRGVGRVVEVKVRAEDHKVSDTGPNTDEPSVIYRGQTSSLRRLIRGVDFDELSEGHIRVEDDLRQRLETLHYELITPVTVQDAVDFAYFLVETTIKMQRFSDGTVIGRAREGRGPVPGCGGAVQCLVVEQGGVRWLARNDLTVPTGPIRPAVGPD